MLLSRRHRLWPLVLLGCSVPAAAGRPDPLDASAAVAPAVHASAFQNYRRLSDVSPRDWKATNDNVGRIGGWRAYAREANEPAATPSETPASTVPKSPTGHHGDHGMPKKAAP
jgi:hypothetical protein